MTTTKPRTDSELKRAVSDELAWTPSVNSTHIGVAVTGGAVTLSGEASNLPEKHAASKAALRVRGVTAVADEVTVRDPGTWSNDSNIAREAVDALTRSVEVPDHGVQATVEQHVITLTGTVAWQYQREAATRAVRSLRGLTRIVNDIQVSPQVSPGDIKASITAALVRAAELEGRHTDVTSDDAGVVTLRGTVHSWSERQAAAHVAWSAPGVSLVLNELRVSS